MKIYVINHGDFSVGLSGFEITVSIDDHHGVLDEGDFESFIKDSLKEYFSHFDGRTSVLEEKDIDAMTVVDDFIP